MLDKIKAIELFNRIAELKSFARAADCLGLSHPVASRMIAELEKELGVQLLHRTTRSVSLTSAGVLFFEKSQKIEELTNSLFSDSPLTNNTTQGKIRIGCSGSFARFYLLKTITRFLTEYKEIQIELIIVDGEIKLSEQRLDIAFQTGGQINPNYIVHRVGQCESILCASENYLQIHGVPRTPKDLQGHQLLSNLHLPQNWTLTQNDVVEEIPVKGAFACNNASLIMDAVLQGLGIGLLPDIALSHSSNSQCLVPLLSEWHFPSTEIMALVDHRYLPSSVRSFLDYVRKDLSADKRDN